MLETRSAPSLKEARTDLATEWNARQPQTPTDIHAFYGDPDVGDLMKADLDAWHNESSRQSITEMIKVVARHVHAQTMVDIGAGAGHDLRALTGIVPFRHGIEPNPALRKELAKDFVVHSSVETACDQCKTGTDLYVCFDVLEHVPDPEALLEGILGQARIGATFFESAATHDIGTPLHLKSNRGWRPGRWLEQHGWWQLDKAGRVCVWEKQFETGQPTQTLLAACSRVPTLLWTSNRTTGDSERWRMRANVGDALLTRSRSILAHNWWIDTGDDVFLMVDDDIDFSRKEADRAIEYCRNGYDIMSGAYPVRDGSHLACRFLPNTGNISFGPGQKPIEIMYAATGFMAVHRRVLDGMAKTLPLVNSGDPWYYPFFQELFRHDDIVGGMLELSEDWGFCALARDAGFKVWLDLETMLSHEGRTVPLTVANMKEIQGAIAKA